MRNQAFSTRHCNLRSSAEDFGAHRIFMSIQPSTRHGIGPIFTDMTKIGGNAPFGEKALDKIESMVYNNAK